MVPFFFSGLDINTSYPLSKTLPRAVLPTTLLAFSKQSLIATTNLLHLAFNEWLRGRLLMTGFFEGWYMY